MSKANSNTKTTTALVDNPLEGEELLLDAMYGPVTQRRQPEAKRQEDKPNHYKIVSISLYTEDIQRLDRMVKELKRRGVYKANKSQLIRTALARLDLEELHRDDFDGERPARALPQEESPDDDRRRGVPAGGSSSY